MFGNDDNTSLYLYKVFPLFFRERTTFLSGFWDHRLQHASHLYLPEANEAAGDEFTGAGELSPAMRQCKARGGFLPLGLWGG